MHSMTGRMAASHEPIVEVLSSDDERDGLGSAATEQRAVVTDGEDMESDTEYLVEEDPPYQGQEKEATLIAALRQVVQNPPPGPFRRQDLTWDQYVTCGRGRYHANEVVVIPWCRLQDFIDGEESDPDYPCKFNKKIKKKNLPGTVAVPRANTPSLLIRCNRA